MTGLAEIPWGDLTWPDVIGIGGIAAVMLVTVAVRAYPHVRAWFILRSEEHRP